MGAVINVIVWPIAMIVNLITIFGGVLTGSKGVLDLFNAALRKIKPGEPTTPADLESARATADLIRSLALMGFLEYLLWATKVFFIVRLSDQALRRLEVITGTSRDGKEP